MKNLKTFLILTLMFLLVSCGTAGEESSQPTQNQSVIPQTSEQEATQDSEQSSQSGLESDSQLSEESVSETEGIYLNISAEEAKEIMDSESDYIILDVRTVEEYTEKHIPGAVLIPDYEIREKAEKILTDKNQLLLVYCRSGRRSKNAAEDLVDLGYTNIMEFGGIIDWPYETVSGN